MRDFDSWGLMALIGLYRKVQVLQFIRGGYHWLRLVGNFENIRQFETPT